MDALTHIDEAGRARMVDVSGKPVVERYARAKGAIRLAASTIELIRRDEIAKGNVLVTAELAGVQAAKQTSTLIPLCHPLLLNRIQVAAELTETGVEVVSQVGCSGKTGVEMEALTAVSVALLTIYDMCKAVDKDMVIESVELLCKTKIPAGDAGNE